MLKVGYLGPEGTFSEEAGKIYAKKLEGKVDMIPYSTLHDILMDVEKNKINEAVVPIENSVEGTIGIVTDMLAKDVNLKVRQEIIVPIYHNLIGQKGVKVSSIKEVISHPQGLDQCKEFLRKNLPKAKMLLSYSTSEAVKQVAASSHPNIAAVGSRASAELYGLKILAAKINPSDNKTRFVVLAKTDHKPTGHDKTSLVFSIAKDRPGGLFAILGEFAERKINLTKIESRPSKKALGDYYFFIDLIGHRTDKLAAEALKAVEKKAAFFKMLGSYPKSKI